LVRKEEETLQIQGTLFGSIAFYAELIHLSLASNVKFTFASKRAPTNGTAGNISILADSSKIRSIFQVKVAQMIAIGITK
jgi:hypothetical protein